MNKAPRTPAQLAALRAGREAGWKKARAAARPFRGEVGQVRTVPLWLAGAGADRLPSLCRRIDPATRASSGSFVRLPEWTSRRRDEPRTGAHRGRSSASVRIEAVPETATAVRGPGATGRTEGVAGETSEKEELEAARAEETDSVRGDVHLPGRGPIVVDAMDEEHAKEVAMRELGYDYEEILDAEEIEPADRAAEPDRRQLGVSQAAP